jgi:triosephosphate isomerase
MARKNIVAGNWKMNTSPVDAAELATAIADHVKMTESPLVVLCPPYTSIAAARAAVKGSAVRLGGQDIYWKESGAYTGEVSGRMLLTSGCSHVILGHSERRQLFFETNITVNTKLKAALDVGLIPIVCVGETLDQREAGQMEAVIREQVLGCFDGVEPADFSKSVIAYEPVWAIGTGKTASPEQAEEVHGLIRSLLRKTYVDRVDETPILYGGSVKPDNAADLFAKPNIDGALVGGASLKADLFIPIIAAAS